MDFWNKIENLHKINRSSLVIGLDPVIDKLPENIEKNNGGILKFIEQI
ncbi:orotidine 5'-phosphate decarboxylase, partial [bacterium]